ncbi:hypothetical protein HLH34_07690 [Gluconacetobacter azotocaptans]|uniref:Uncharacterized protein n=1 Tax=Gluconacetobacter azotocaptans TaxID=142834 RepID=A0A7W4JS19_9PROT|nr:hypothetical protein [Gluconacetobacter azotocaptans]MBB2189848.1 hypothetical protein [Gluconacetobacter azotocaptans]MBM9402691.1 hypothetical protein [Gluconacetobacter azotocaptans]
MSHAIAEGVIMRNDAVLSVKERKTKRATMGRAGGVLGACVLAAGLSGCVGPTGPVYGQWSGYQPDGATGYERNVQLVLDGKPDARGGIYHLRAMQMNPMAQLQGAPGGYVDNRWVLSTVTVNRRTLNRIHLLGMPATQYATYDMLPDRTLVPDIGGESLEASERAAMAYRLSVRPRDSYAYGRI